MCNAAERAANKDCIPAIVLTLPVETCVPCVEAKETSAMTKRCLSAILGILA